MRKVDAPPRQPARSISRVRAPQRAAATAAATPALPPPTTMTSYSVITLPVVPSVVEGPCLYGPAAYYGKKVPPFQPKERLADASVFRSHTDTRTPLMRLSVIVTDPWDLGEYLKWAPLQGTVIRLLDDTSGGRALIRLDAPLDYQDTRWKLVMASPRHERAKVSNLQFGAKVLCGILGVLDEQADAPLLTMPSHSRLYFIGNLQRLA